MEVTPPNSRDENTHDIFPADRLDRPVPPWISGEGPSSLSWLRWLLAFGIAIVVTLCLILPFMGLWGRLATIIEFNKPIPNQDGPAWQEAKRTDTKAAYEAYLATFPRGTNAAEAARMIQKINALRPLSTAEESALHPGSAFQECEYCPIMVVVPSGTFSMGAPQSEIDQHHAFPNEGPGHTVSISRPFAVGKFEVTFDQWDACIQDGGCRGFRPSDSGWGRQKHPVINISWDDAKLYVKWLSNKTGKVYRLLSEAEWEYAARAGSTAKYFFGDDPMSLCRYANIADDSGNAYRYPSTGFRAWLTCNDGYFHTAPVGSFVSNDFGLYDVLGNVSEWVEDGWHDNYQGAPTDGSTWVAGADPQLHVARGGSWYSLQDGVTSSVRYKYVASPGGELVGLRIARTLGQ